MSNYTERIDQYLSNTLSVEEKLDFENELKANESLASEFELQKNIMEGLKRAGIKHEFSQAIKHQILMKGIAKIAGLVVVASALATLGYFILGNQGNSATGDKNEPSTEHLAPEKFEPGSGDTMIETREGNVIISPAQSFKKDVKTMEHHIDSLTQPRPLQGLCVDYSRMYYFKDKVLYCQDIFSDKILSAYEPNEDTLLVNSLADRIIKMRSINNDTAKEIARKRIKNFYVLNVSVHHHHVYLGVRFKIENKRNSKLYYALLEFDYQLAFKNYYIVKDLRLFTMPAYHALQFKDENTIYMPSINQEKKADWGMGYYEFVFDKTHHSLICSSPVVKELNIYKTMHVMSTLGLVMDPVLYVVANSKATYFFHHPHPILYDMSGKGVFEPYITRHQVDSIYSARERHGWGNDYSFDPQFYGAYKTYGHIILSAGQIDSTIYMVVSNKDENKTDLAAYHIGTRKKSIMTLPVRTSLKYSYFVFDNKNLYILDYSKGKGSIIIKVLKP